MAQQEPFKSLIDAGAVAALGEAFAAARPGWAPAPFVAAASAGLEPLELKARVRHVARTLRAHLDDDWPAALAHALDALPPPLEGTEGVNAHFGLWPVCQLVEDHGLGHFEISMAALREMTRRFTAEFAVRPYLEQDPERGLEILRGWASDPDPHVRRLASEGSRPRLPWGRRLRRFQERPAETLEILEILKDDPVRYVQRSVGNHLNDIAKDHPALAVKTGAAWRVDAPPGRAWVVRRGLRGLIKAGHPGALAVMGFGPPQIVVERFALGELRVTLGGDGVRIEVALRSTAAAPQRLMIDYAVHHRKADGGLRPKVFKWTERALAPGEALVLQRTHPMRPISTRRYYPGTHRIELKINGLSMGTEAFTLEIPG